MTKAPQPSARLKVKVVPGSSRDEIVGWLGDALKIKVTAPPENGPRQADDCRSAIGRPILKLHQWAGPEGLHPGRWHLHQPHNGPQRLSGARCATRLQTVRDSCRA
ncbi:MAG: DUF167 domain-containing protein [Planctomycetota bacterium]